MKKEKEITGTIGYNRKLKEELEEQVYSIKFFQECFINCIEGILTEIANKKGCNSLSFNATFDWPHVNEYESLKLVQMEIGENGVEFKTDEGMYYYLDDFLIEPDIITYIVEVIANDGKPIEPKQFSSKN